MPVIEEAWNLPISAEMTARQQQQQQTQRQTMIAQQQKGAFNGSNGVNQQGNQALQQSEIPAKRFKVCNQKSL